jgi:hypothetical protein
MQVVRAMADEAMADEGVVDGAVRENPQGCWPVLVRGNGFG